jgi:hypothetical protein
VISLEDLTDTTSKGKSSRPSGCVPANECLGILSLELVLAERSMNSQQLQGHCSSDYDQQLRILPVDIFLPENNYQYKLLILFSRMLIVSPNNTL